MLKPNFLQWLYRNIAIILGFMAFSLIFCSPGWCQVPGIVTPTEQKPAATVKVEVKDSEGKKPAEIKVEVEGKEVETKTVDQKGKASSSMQLHPEEKIAPVDTEKIDEAGKQVGKKLDEVAESSSYVLGDWVRSVAFNGITWLKLVATVLMLLVVMVVERVLNYLIKRRLRRIGAEERTPTWFEVLLEALCRPLGLFIWVYGSYFALSPLFVHFEIPFGTNVLKDYAEKVADIGGLFTVVWFIFRAIRLVDLELDDRAKAPESKIDDLQVSLVGKTLRWIIAIAGSIVIVQYVTGFQAGPLIASLGIGGLAIALAAKESIENLFGTVTIVFDKPFKVGDRIALDKYDGFVESVGYRSTKLRLWNGNLVNIPNEKITNSHVENYSRRPHISWSTNITITYDTPPHKVDRAVEIIKEILENDDETSGEWPPLVFFDEFNEWSLNIRVKAWFNPEGQEPIQSDYYSWRQRMCRKILRRFGEEDIEFAFPTRTTLLANDDKRQIKLMMLSGQEQEAALERFPNYMSGA
jgi:MscS family membrane protein